MSRLNVNTISGVSRTVPEIAVPAFRAYLSTSQSVSTGAITKVNIDTKTGDNFFDTNGWFDTTNNRYTPQIAGYYSFNGIVRIAGTSQTTQGAYLYKNDTQYAIGNILLFSTSSVVFPMVSTIAYMNGITDYMDLRGIVNGTTPSFGFSTVSATSIFEGFLVRAA